MIESAETSKIWNARHGFDVQGAPSVLEIGNGMTMGYHEAAAVAAWREMVEFIGSSP